MTSLTDPIDGLLTTTENDYQTEITGVTNQISDRQAKVTQMKSDLTNQMNAADAMINSLQQQYTNLSGLLQAEAIAAPTVQVLRNLWIQLSKSLSGVP